MMVKYRFNTIIIFISFLFLFLSIGFASASDNITNNAPIDDIVLSDMEIIEDCCEDVSPTNKSERIVTAIQTKNVNSYYKENTELVSYLKDVNNRPISK